MSEFKMFTAAEARGIVKASSENIEAYLKDISNRIIELSKEGKSELILDSNIRRYDSDMVFTWEDDMEGGRDWHRHTAFQEKVWRALSDAKYRLDFVDRGSFKARLKISWY